MPCIKSVLCSDKKGFSLTEIMIALSIFSLLTLGMAGSVMMKGRSFRYNVASNQNIQDASNALQRIVYGDGAHWGLRVASRSRLFVVSNGLVGPDGQLGFQVNYEHTIPITHSTPSNMAEPEQTLIYDPLARSLSLNGTLIAENVMDAYFTFNGSSASLGLQVANKQVGLQSMVETRCTLRN